MTATGAPGSSNTPQHGLVYRLVRGTGNVVKGGLTLIGFAATAAGYIEYKRLFPDESKGNIASRFRLSGGSTDDADSKKNRVLVIPFHRMKLVESKDRSFREMFKRFDSTDGDDGDTPTPYEVRELVELLHAAAADPNITAVYGIFGHGGQGLNEAGWAQLEEVRNALQVVKESHRRHPEPNLTHQPASQVVMPVVPHKPLYAYADSFASYVSPSNKDYYLASVFTHIHLQEKGELNLFGMMSQQIFLRKLLEKYGIQMHVFKQGQYKNFPNMFTHQTFNKYHLENVSNLLSSMNSNVCKDITNSRYKALAGSSWLTKYGKKPHRKDDETQYHKSIVDLWKRIYENGTFSAEAACKAGIVDYLPRRDPLSDLVDRNASEGKDEVELKPSETNFEGFPADETISLKEYSKQISKRKKAVDRRLSWREYAAKSPILQRVWPDVAATTTTPKEKIALLEVDGAIGDEMANKLVSSIRKIRKDEATKCVVMRVSSPGGSIQACETIQQELKALNLPVVVSFGDVSASGGYYISASADRIFASKKTITGSIGVFGLRIDLTDFLARYGVNVEHVPSSEFSGSYDPLHPMTRKMKLNMSDTIDRHYTSFKQLVSDGRSIPVERVEPIAQGRVWTGDQAKSIGLVDEVGGLHRAIAYARRTYTSNNDDETSDVVVWPKKRTIIERLMSAENAKTYAQLLMAFWTGELNDDGACERVSSMNQSARVVDALNSGMVDWILHSPSSGIPGTLSGVLMTMDENSTIQCLLLDSLKKK